MKSYTDLEQSKKLAKILAIETSDYYYPVTYIEESTNKYLMCYIKPYIGRLSDVKNSVDTRLYIPCWSLASLFDVLPDTINVTEGYCRLTIDKEGDAYNISYDNIFSEGSVILYAEYSLIDACYEMIIKLNELNLL